MRVMMAFSTARGPWSLGGMVAALSFGIGCDSTPADTEGDSSGTSGSQAAGTSGAGQGGGSSGPTTTTGSGASGSGGAQSGACEGLVGEGWAEGQIAENWSLPDVDGQMVELYDFCGKVVYFEEGAGW
jgi:hypothetical protein